jgi:hypothetical protein
MRMRIVSGWPIHQGRSSVGWIPMGVRPGKRRIALVAGAVRVLVPVRILFRGRGLLVRVLARGGFFVWGFWEVGALVFIIISQSYRHQLYIHIYIYMYGVYIDTPGCSSSLVFGAAGCCPLGSLSPP